MVGEYPLIALIALVALEFWLHSPLTLSQTLSAIAIPHSQRCQILALIQP